MNASKYYTYIIRCDDESLYTGITTDIKRRFEEHSSKSSKGAKYTKNHKPKRIEAVWESDSRALASKLEYRIKKLPKEKKQLLIDSNNIEILNEKINVEDYRRLALIDSYTAFYSNPNK